MTHSNKPLVWIGCVFDVPDIDYLRELLDPNGYFYTLEGSRVAGYSICVSESDASAILDTFPMSRSCEPGKLRVFLHSRPYTEDERRSHEDLNQWLAWRKECFEKDP